MSDVKADIMANITQSLVRLFELEASEIVESARLYEDLDIDSIDTIDLLIELKKFYGKDVEAEAFVNARTLGDVVDIISGLVANT